MLEKPKGVLKIAIVIYIFSDTEKRYLFLKIQLGT